MSKLTAYTLEMYKKDGRIKKDARYGRDKKGLRFIDAMDFDPVTKAYINETAEAFRRRGFVVQIMETYVTQKNCLNGQEFKERYDTPSYCSPSSESYWSM